MKDEMLSEGKDWTGENIIQKVVAEYINQLASVISERNYGDVHTSHTLRS